MWDGYVAVDMQHFNTVPAQWCEAVLRVWGVALDIHGTLLLRGS